MTQQRNPKAAAKTEKALEVTQSSFGSGQAIGAGAGVGTILAAIVQALPDGNLKNIGVILLPAISGVASFIYAVVENQLKQRQVENVAPEQIEKLRLQLEQAKIDSISSKEYIDDLQKKYEAAQLLLAEIRVKKIAKFTVREKS